MLAACAEWGLSFFCGRGEGGWGRGDWGVQVFLASSVFDLFIPFGFIFSFSFFLFLVDSLILDGNSQRAVKSKTTNLSADQLN